MARPWGDRIGLAFGCAGVAAAAGAWAGMTAGSVTLGAAAYVIMASLLELGLFALDKRRARVGGRRIREATLLGLGVLGGAAGGLMAMRGLRHKTRRPRFGWILAGAALLHAAALLVLVALAG